MSLSVVVRSFISARNTKSLDLSSALESLVRQYEVVFTDGVAADQGNRFYHDQHTLAASATLDLDLKGSLVDIFGNAFTPARLKYLLVAASIDNTNNVNLIRPTAGVPFMLAEGDGEPIHPGCFTHKVWRGTTAVPVTATTADLIRFTNSAAGTPVTFDVFMIGAST